MFPERDDAAHPLEFPVRHRPAEPRSLREPRRHPGEPGHHAEHGQDRQGGVRVHRGGPGQELTKKHAHF